MQYHPPSGSTDANAPYIGKNVAAGTSGSKIPPGMPEFTQREIVNAISFSGQTPTDSDLYQLTRTIRGGQLDFDATDTGTADSVACQIGLAHTTVKAGLPFTFLKGPNDNTGAPITITITDLQGANPISGTLLKNNGKSGPAKGDVPANSLVTVRADTSGNFRIVSMVTISDVMALIQANTRTLLRVNVTVYVRPDGSDANTDGRSDTAVSAFKTPQGAYNAVAQLYILSGFSIAIQLSKTYATQVLGSPQPVSYPGLIANNVGVSGSISLLGDTGSPQNYVLTPVNSPTYSCVISQIQSLTVQGVTLDGSNLTSSQTLFIVSTSSGGSLFIGNSVLKYIGTNLNAASIQIDPNSSVYLNGPITEAVGSIAYGILNNGGNFSCTTSVTWYASSTTHKFFVSQNGGQTQLSAITFSGSGNTGSPYNVLYGYVSPPASGISTIPGNVAGTVALGGGYVPGDLGTPWTAGMPSVGATSGALGSAGGYYRYQRLGKTVSFQLQVNIGTVGTGTGSIITSLPIAPASNVCFVGKDTGASGKMLAATANVGNTGLGITNFDNSSPIVASATMVFTGQYEALN